MSADDGTLHFLSRVDLRRSSEMTARSGWRRLLRFRSLAGAAAPPISL